MTEYVTEKSGEERFVLEVLSFPSEKYVQLKTQWRGQYSIEDKCVQIPLRVFKIMVTKFQRILDMEEESKHEESR